MSNKQLYTILPDLELANYFDPSTGIIIYREAHNLPLIFWPTGMPCTLANAWMISLMNRNLSRKNKGGSLRQFAGDISHLIRYCFENGLDLDKLDNDHFTSFISKLRNETNPLNSSVRKRGSNTLTNIGRRCLAFLNFVGDLAGDEKYVTHTLHAVRKTWIKPTRYSNKSIELKGWYHTAFDTAGPKKNRLPIASDVIQAFYIAIPELSSSNNEPEAKLFLERRRICLLHLLEKTGARIEEIAQLRVEDIEKAMTEKHPHLRLITLKRSNRYERNVPILHQDLAVLKPYLRLSRLKFMHNTIGLNKDHGYFFISAQTGKPISSSYMSNEIGLLRKAAGIKTQACAHMFRNRYITKLFVKLINQYEFENQDDFRKALLDANTLKQVVQQHTGHSNVNSLDVYIDFAFEEVANLHAVKNVVHIQNVFETFDAKVDLMHRDLAAGKLTNNEYLEKYTELRHARLLDTSSVDQIFVGKD